MFTGIIKEIGNIANIDSVGGGVRIRIAANESSLVLNRDDSVAVNGVCLTVIACDQRSFEVEAVEETLLKTSLGSLKANERVNLELPLRLQDRLGGHIVLGHVDAIGTIVRIETRESSWMFGIEIPGEFLHYVVHTGSIAIDGVSLTVAAIEDYIVQVSIIPHTMMNTVCRYYKLNDTVNLEFDVIGKYIERLVTNGSIEHTLEKRDLSEKHLRELGF